MTFARTHYVNAKLVSPAQGLVGKGYLTIEGGWIIAAALGDLPQGNGHESTLIDCAGKVLIPGLIDMRVFTGEPGSEYRETLASASEAAAAGGITTMIVMPNTDPIIDDAAIVDFILRRARDTALVRVLPMAAMTKGLKGEAMSEIGLLKESGAVALTDATKAVANASLFRRILSYARDFNMPVVQHVEDATLATGVMNSGEIASRLGLSGVSSLAEVIMLERDIRLAEATGGRYHAAQISCAQSVEIIRAAKLRKIPVTCGVSIHHLILNENDVGAYRTFFKISPPLRSETDRIALVEGLNDGTIDVIVSSHDPQSADTKRLPFAEAAFGAIGLETMLSAALTMHNSGHVSLERLVDAMSHRPAQILGLDTGRLAPGAPADFVLLDPEKSWQVNETSLHSRSKNSPFEHGTLQGLAIQTVVAGQTVFTYS